MNKKNEEIVKYLMLEKVQNLKGYAIYYSNYQKIIKTDIKNINNIENEKKTSRSYLCKIIILIVNNKDY